MNYLDWPEELVCSNDEPFRWLQPASNICLDFHGNPTTAQLVVFSDGNHHMALLDCLEQFRSQQQDLKSIFYATTPPGPVINLLRHGALKLGNLIISVDPHVFISPPDVLDRLGKEYLVNGHRPFVRNQGNVILLKRGNPRTIREAADLLRDDVTLFLSHPDNEKASFSAYYQTLAALLPDQDAEMDFLAIKRTQQRLLFGTCIHHREAPQAVAAGMADAAVVFYHLALRYKRIFPEIFDVLPLGGTLENPEPVAGNVICTTSRGLVGDGGRWGGLFHSFLGSSQAQDIYRHHGLLPLTAEGSELCTSEAS